MNNDHTNTITGQTLAEISEQALTEVRAEISRVDTKASILAGLSLAALTGGAALASKAHLSGFALAAAITTATLIGTALILLGAAIRPALGGNHGFMRWAATADADDLVCGLIDADSIYYTATKTRSLAQSTRRKYQRVRLAVDLLGLALLCAGLTALLSALD